MRFLKIRWSAVIVGLFLITACTNEGETNALLPTNEQVQEQELESSPQTEEGNGEIEYIFPESMELNFRAVELIKMEPSAPATSWKLVHSIPLGKIEDEPVELVVYQVSDSETPCSFQHEAAGLLAYKGETYGVPDCLSYSFIGEDSDPSQDVIKLEERFVDDMLEHNFVLQGAAALTANGPGRMGYFYYDKLQDHWHMFIDWGRPVITDLDEDEQREMVIQFEGLHLSWPDVVIYRWQDGVLEASGSVKEQLDIPSMSFNEAVLIEQDKQILVNVHLNGYKEEEEFISAVFNYRDGILNKQEE